MGQAKDSGVLDIDWNGISDLMNRTFRNDESEYRTEAAYRKIYQYAKKMYEDGVFNKYADEDSYFKELQVQKRDIEKESVKVRDERNELRRIIREEARKESYKDQIIRNIIEHDMLVLNYDNNKKFSGILKSDNDMIISVFDVHAGINTNNFFNTYNENVLKERLNKYLDKIFEVKLRHGSEDAYVIMSEMVSGLIHNTLRIESNQDLIEQFLTVTDYISQFISELSYQFEVVHVYMCPGNHSRCVAKKDDSLQHENIDNLVIPFIEAKLQNFKNVHCHTNEIEDSVAMFNVRGQTVFATHGDKDSPNNVIQHFAMVYGIKPDLCYLGHMHTNSMTTIYDSKVIQSGTLAGSDSYCVDKRLKNRPEQTLSIVTENGLDCLYDVKF